MKYVNNIVEKHIVYVLSATAGDCCDEIQLNAVVTQEQLHTR